jgi:GT2 family glycosyltransferase
MSNLSVAVIVLNYRGERVLARCLDSLEPTLGQDDRVLVVDNGQEEALVAALRGRYRRVDFIRAETNRGFAAGMNLGIRHMRGQGQFDAFWLLNNDAFVDPNALNQMKQALMLKGSQALFSPVIRSSEGLDLWYAGGRIDFFRMRTIHEHILRVEQSCFETSFLTGCALFIPRVVIDSIGYLDERYFLYYEDADYSLRASRAGLCLWVVPQAQVYHSEESSQNPEKIYWLVRSGVEFFLRDTRGIWWLWVRALYILRRLKNWLDIQCHYSQVAQKVKQAYTDASI